MSDPWAISRRQLLLLMAAGAACNDSIGPDKARVEASLPLDPAGTRPKVLRIGVAPFLGERTKDSVKPLVAYLQRKLSLEVEAHIAAAYDALATLVHSGQVHVGFFSPVAYVRARGDLPAVAIATATRAGSPIYLGYLVTRKNSYRTLEALEGKSIAWVNRSSTSGYLYPRALLRSQGRNPDSFFGQAIFAGDHVTALTAVLAGQVDVAALASTLIDRPRPDQREQVRHVAVIAKTDRIPLDCVVLHDKLQRALGEQIRDALFFLHHDIASSQSLADAWGIHGFVRPQSALYDEVAKTIEAEPRAR